MVYMELDIKVVLNDNVFYQKIDDEMVLLDMCSDNYFGLDSIGSDIWESIQDSDTLQEVFETLLDKYDVEPERLKSDLLDFVKQLEDKQLIKVVKL